jgi:hypothetical protein
MMGEVARARGEGEGLVVLFVLVLATLRHLVGELGKEHVCVLLKILDLLAMDNLCWILSLVLSACGDTSFP